MAKIAFYKAKHGNWLDYLIAIATFSKYSHCEFILTDGTFVGSSPRDGGVRYKKINQNSGNWDVFDLPNTIDDRDIMAVYHKYQNNSYDWVGAIASLFDIDKSTNGKMFCSEFCAIALGLRPSRPPSRLYKAMVRKRIITKEPQIS